MARALVVVLCLAALTLPPSTDAQAGLREGEWLVGPRFGWSFPIGSFNDIATGSWSAGASVDYAFANDFTFGATVATNRFSDQPVTFRDALETDNYEADLRIPQLTVHFRGLFEFENRLQIFGKIGMGFYAKNISVQAPESPIEDLRAIDQSELTAGSALSAGFWIPVFGKHMVEVEMAYHFLWDEDPAFNVQKQRSTFWLLSGSFLFSLGGS